jgi:hypothetical protein
LTGIVQEEKPVLTLTFGEPVSAGLGMSFWVMVGEGFAFAPTVVWAFRRSAGASAVKGKDNLLKFSRECTRMEANENRAPHSFVP